jgi:CHRD domain
VQQAHVHFGQEDVNGGVSVFLCSNLAGAPAGVQACPPAPATITGTIAAGDVVGPAEQGIAPGELAELLAAMRAGVTYANVHSDKFPNGEIRGQIHTHGNKHHGKHRGDKDDDDNHDDD